MVGAVQEDHKSALLVRLHHPMARSWYALCALRTNLMKTQTQQVRQHLKTKYYTEVQCFLQELKSSIQDYGLSENDEAIHHYKTLASCLLLPKSHQSLSSLSSLRFFTSPGRAWLEDEVSQPTFLPG